jgi:hypothetical protein
MGIFGPGVGGGFLAAAGAIGGAGKGLADVGEAQQKMNLETKLQDLTQKREEAITRLQGQQQSGLEEQRAGHEKERVGEEIAGRSAVAHYETGEKEAEAEKGRQSVHTENAAKFASEETRNAATNKRALEVARIKAAGSQKAPPPEWKSTTLNIGATIDPVSHMPVGGKGVSVNIHRDGSKWVQAGDRMYPYDAQSADGLGNIDASRRARAEEVQKLLQNPLAVTPSGMSAKDSFYNRNGYLPTAYMSAAQKASDAARSSGGNTGGGAAPGNDNEQEEPDEPDSSVPMAGAPQPQ